MNLPLCSALPTLLFGLTLSLIPLQAEEASRLATLEKGLSSIDKDASSARQRLGVRRAIRDAETAIEEVGAKPERWALLEFLFRARQRLVTMENEKEHRDALLAVCAELVKAPKEYAAKRLDADLLLSQVEQARLGGDKEARAEALKQFAGRYTGTPVVSKALKTACIMALEQGDEYLIKDLREMIDAHCAADHEMIAFQRDRFAGLPFGAPFAGALKRSDGKVVHFPMDVIGRTVIVVFWSKEGEGMDYVRGLAEAAKQETRDLTGQVEVVSMNLDELPDAGESIIRGLGVDWPCFLLPGGREHAIYTTYARRDPMRLRLGTNGQAALVMAGLDRVRVKEDGSPDYGRILGLDRSFPWTIDSYRIQLCSLSAGDFLIFDPQGFESAMPPELWRDSM